MIASRSLRRTAWVAVLGYLAVGATAFANHDGLVDFLNAEADYVKARLARVNAELALEASLKNDPEVVAAEGELALTRSEQKRSQDRAEWSRRMREKGYVSAARQTDDELTAQKTDFEADRARAAAVEARRKARARAPQALRDAVARLKAEEEARRSALARMRRS